MRKILFSRSMPTYDGGGEDDGHGVVENALPKDQHIQYWLHVQGCIHTGTMSHESMSQTKQRCRFRNFIAIGTSGTKNKCLPYQNVKNVYERKF